MTLYTSVSSALPVLTNVIMGMHNGIPYHLDLTQQNEETNKIVSDFISIVGKNIYVTIENYPGDLIFESDIVIPEETTLERITIDYAVLSESDQAKVTNYYNLAIASIPTM